MCIQLCRQRNFALHEGLWFCLGRLGRLGRLAILAFLVRQAAGPEVENPSNSIVQISWANGVLTDLS